LRVDPRAMVPGARSIIVVSDRYPADATISGQGEPADASRPAMGKIARYARGDDYHTVIRKRLHALCDALAAAFPGEIFRACVDTAPVLEREHAHRAGVGAVAKNTLLLQRGIGSYLLLGEIMTTAALEPSAPSEPDPCGTCTRCIDACPTDAITPWSVDATRCISYLTIEHRSLIHERYHAAIGDWIFGCDICQEVCPHNQPTTRTRTAATHPAYAPRREGFDLLEVLNWDESARRQAFIKSSMKRAKLNMMKRNALIAAGNALRQHFDAVLAERIRELACDSNEDELVRAAAQQVLNRLRSEGIYSG
jgi:epoxyqueuosine reductase